MTREERPTHDTGIDRSNEIQQPPTESSTRNQRGSREPLVDLNFKVPREFRRRFRRLAADADIRNVELLKQAIESYEREQTKKTDAPRFPTC